MKADKASMSQKDLLPLKESSRLVALASAIATAMPKSYIRMSHFPWPYYFIGTRDSFSYKLVAKTQVTAFCNAPGLGFCYLLPTKTKRCILLLS